MSTSLGKPVEAVVSPRKDAVICVESWLRQPGLPSNIILKGSAQFERLTARIGKQKAIVAIARKLLVTIWHRREHSRNPIAMRKSRL